MMLISVDLPAPFWPTRETISPARTARSTSVSARTPGNVLETPSRLSSGGSGGIRGPPAHRIREPGGDDDASLDHRLIPGDDASQGDDVHDDREQHAGEHRVEQSSSTTFERDAADDGDGDRRELESLGLARFRRSQS